MICINSRSNIIENKNHIISILDSEKNIIDSNIDNEKLK